MEQSRIIYFPRALPFISKEHILIAFPSVVSGQLEPCSAIPSGLALDRTYILTRHIADYSSGGSLTRLRSGGIDAAVAGVRDPRVSSCMPRAGCFAK